MRQENVDKKSETGDWRWETGNKIRRQDQETVDWRQEMRDRKMRPGT